MATALEIRQSDKILDAGCGVGGTSIWLAEQYGARVTGITLSQKQLEIAKKNAQKRKVSHLVNFEIRDFCNTNFSNESFDKIFGIESTCYAQDKEKFLRESYRLLKPGGKLTMADFYINKPLSKRGERLVSDFCQGWEIPNLPSLDEIKQQMQKIGFQNVEILDKTKEIEPSSRRMFFVMGRLVRSGLKLLEFLRLHKGRGGTKATVSQYYMFREGFATYNIISAQKIIGD